MNAGAGALLALATSFAVRAHASTDPEGARAAAPISCVSAQFALRAYVTALETGDVTSGAQDPTRIPKAITPLCRQAIDDGRWPGLADELLPRATDASMRSVLCEIAPPEALSAIAAWETAGNDGDDSTRAAYDLPCAMALFRHRAADFTKVVLPRIAASSGCSFSDLPRRLGEGLRTDERVALLPTLDFATRTRSQGRDQLFRVLCQHPAARAQAACQAPEVLEPAWAHEARVRRALPAIGFHVGLAASFALAASLLRRRRGKDWPAVWMSVAATAATSAAVAWIITTRTTSGPGTFGASNAVVPLVVAPLAALGGGVLAWVVIRTARRAALPWCLGHAAVYGLVTAVHTWTRALDRLC